MSLLRASLPRVSRTCMRAASRSSCVGVQQPHAASATGLTRAVRATPFSMRSGPDTPHTSVRPSSFASAAYTSRSSGPSGSNEWRLFLQLQGKDVSAWHDIPLLAQGSSSKQLLFNYINEIPKGTRPKMEIATKEAGTPIKQDVKKGKLRQFTYGDIPFNYGCLPQTWEDPHETHPLTGLNGDNDPIDVVELSGAPIAMGAVQAVKVLGVMALLDEGETDWKLLAIDAAHPLAASMSNVADLESHFPGKVAEVREWFRNYKTTDGKPQNQFAFDEQVQDVGLALKVVWETHAAWSSLVRGESPAGELWRPKEVPQAAKGE